MIDLEPLTLLSAEPELGFVLPPGLRRLYGGDLGLPERCLYANFVQTIDGVVAIPSVPDSNRIVSGGSASDRFVMGLLRAAADVVLIGSGTLRASARGRWRPDTVFPDAAEAYAELRRELRLDPQARVAILTASGSIPRDRAVLEDAPLVLTTNVGAERLADTLPAGVEVVELPGDAAVDIRSAVELLRGRGHRRILSEAGPHVFGSLVEAGLVDELFLTVSPVLAGRPPAGSFALVEGAALLPEQVQHAHLRSARVHGSHLFLQYALS
jgi:riboflavin biosynthesis pyrimidine reductase